jgi:hypothetical protein
MLYLECHKFTLSRCPASIDYQLGASDKFRLVRGKIKDGMSNVYWLTQTPGGAGYDGYFAFDTVHLALLI